MLRSNFGEEYMSHEFHDFNTFQMNCLSVLLSLYSSAKWVVERKNRHLLDVVRTFCLNNMFLLNSGLMHYLLQFT
jgi:hypothetical protein